MDFYGFVRNVYTYSRFAFRFVRFACPWAAAVRGGGPKIIRKSMLKRGAQKGGSKGEHKWLEHSLFCHLLLIRIEPARSKRCLQLSTTSHKNLKCHRKCLHLGSHFGSFLKHIAERNPKSQDGWCQTTMLPKS